MGLLGTQEPYFNGPELDHQVLTRLDAKYLQEVAKFDQKGLFLRGFIHLIFFKLDGQVQNPLNWVPDFPTDPHTLSALFIWHVPKVDKQITRNRRNSRDETNEIRSSQNQ